MQISPGFLAVISGYFEAISSKLHENEQSTQGLSGI
jgi:hypothetical protein